jgi:hypothetical protein
LRRERFKRADFSLFPRACELERNALFRRSTRRVEREVSNLFILTNFSSFVKRRLPSLNPLLEKFPKFFEKFSLFATVYKNGKKCELAGAGDRRFLIVRARMASELHK